MDENYIIANYNIINFKSNTQILGKDFDLTQIKSILINNIEVEISSSYRFETPGTKEITIIFNTVSFKNCKYMFFDCTSLISLDLSNFSTDNITNMEGMFHNCSELKSLNLFNLNTEKVTDMYALFGNCHSLTALDLSNFDTSNVINMMFMFSNCRNLTSITMTGDTSKAESLWMFRGISTNGTLYYNSKHDYSHIIQQLPDSWKAIAI